MEQKPYTLQQKAHVACFIILWIALLFFAVVMVFTMPATALEINPSIHDKDPWWCENKVSSWICGDKGNPGVQGINGTRGDPGEPNFTAIYYNATNFTAIANFTHFYNATNFNITSNYTVVNGASFYNTTAINESYAYLPGRAGGQNLNGGTGATDEFTINSTSESGAYTSRLDLQKRAGIVRIAAANQFNSQTEIYGRLLVYNASNQAIYLANSSAAGIYFNSPTGGRIYYLGHRAMEGQTSTATNPRSYLNLAETFNFAYFSKNVSVGASTNPTAQFQTSGTVRLTNFGAGTATFDAGGNITSVSDSKAKTNIAPYPAGLAQVLQLTPKQYKYSPDSGLDTQNTYVGFIAQDVEKVLPDAVKTKDDVKYEQKLLKKGATADEDEYTTVEIKTGTQTKSLDDRAIIAALVNAVKEQQVEINALNERIKKLEVTKT